MQGVKPNAQGSTRSGEKLASTDDALRQNTDNECGSEENPEASGEPGPARTVAFWRYSQDPSFNALERPHASSPIKSGMAASIRFSVSGRS